MVGVISVDAYPFLAFSDLSLSPRAYRNRCFLVALCHLIIRRRNLEVGTKSLLHQQVKSTGVFLVPCPRMEVRP